MTTRKPFTVRPGTVDHGKDNEFKMATLLSLKCTGTDTLDFLLATNVDEGGSFDDVVLFRKKFNGKYVVYLLQLKHQDQATGITPDDFKKPKKKDKILIDLCKYSESIANLKMMIEKAEASTDTEIVEYLRRNATELIFILFTNRPLLQSSNNFVIKVDKNLDLKFINTRGCMYALNYSEIPFAVKKSMEKYMDRLYLFTGQSGEEELDILIRTEVQRFVTSMEMSLKDLDDICSKFLNFITNWSKGKLGDAFFITKVHIIKVLTQILFEPYILKLKKLEGNCNNNVLLWDELVKDKKITIIQDMEEETSNFLNQYIHIIVDQYKNIFRSENLNEVMQTMGRCVDNLQNWKHEDIYEYLWKSDKLPLLLKANNSEEYKKILNIIELSQKTFRVIILYKNASKLSHRRSRKSFTTLKDLSAEHRENILKYPIKLQNRSFADLYTKVDNKVLEDISTKDIINIWSNKFNIGNQYESLPKFYVEKSVPKVLLKYDALKTNNEIFVIRCHPERNIKSFLQKQNIILTDFHIYQYRGVGNIVNFTIQQKIIIIHNEHDWYDIVKYIHLKDTTIHYLIMHNNDDLEWNYSIGTVENIKPFRMMSDTGCSATYDLNEIVRKASNTMCPSTTLICAGPGMGKSVLLDSIAHHAPTTVWVLRINLAETEYTEYYETEDFESACLQPSQHLIYFARTLMKDEYDSDFVKSVFQSYLDSNEILILLDGFDEIPECNQNAVMKMIQCFHESKYPMCLKTRQIMLHPLENILQTFPLALNPFTRIEQEQFLRKYFSAKCDNSEDISETIKDNRITQFVGQLLNAAKRNLCDWDNEFTGVPLQTRLLGKAFAKKCSDFLRSKCFDCEHFDLLYLYENFIKERISILCKKSGVASKDIYNDYQQFRSFYALPVLFSKSDLEELDIDNELQQMKKFIPNAMQKMQKDGIVVVDNESNVMFIHRTFAEYLTAKWLSENFHGRNAVHVQKLIKRTFLSNYSVLRGIFDRIVAKNCPLHLKIINRQLNEAIELIRTDPNNLNKLDNGNRSFLHVLVAWDEHNPVTTKSPIRTTQTAKPILYDTTEMATIIKIIPYDTLNIFCKITDKILSYTPLDYAILSGSLGIADEICSRLTDAMQCITINNKSLHNILNNSEYHLYGCLTMAIIKAHTDNEVKEASSERITTANNHNNPIHYAIKTGDIQRLYELFSADLGMATLDNHDGCFLHVAVAFNQPEIIKFLLKKSNYIDIDKIDETGKTALHWAAINGNTKILTLLLSNGAAADAKDNSKWTPLMYAIHTTTSNKAEVIISLLKKGANAALKGNCSFPTLHQAVLSNQLDILEILIDNKVNQDDGIDFIDKFGRTPIHWAVHYDKPEFVKLLIEKGANPDKKDKISGSNALHGAVVKNHLNITNLLLYKDAPVDTPNTRGNTALLEAAINDNRNIVELLLFKGANVDTKNSEHRTALHLAASEGHTNTVTLLLSKGASLEEKDISGKTALLLAASCGHTNTLNVLLSKEADIEAQDNTGMTALHAAAIGGYNQVVNVLLSRDVNIEGTDYDGTTALTLAAIYGNFNTVDLLLSKGANKEAKDNNGVTALIKAANHGHVDIVRLLLSNGADKNAQDNSSKTACHSAAINGHEDIVKLFLKEAVNKEIRDNNGMTILLSAATYNQANIVALLLAEGADKEVKDYNGMNALLLAATYGHNETVRLLLISGVDIEQQDANGRNAVIKAAINGHSGILRLLLSEKPSLEKRDNLRRTALIHAAYHGHNDAIQLLLDEGANIEAKDVYGMTSLLWAVHNGHINTAQLLVSNKANIEACDEGRMTSLHWAAFDGDEEAVNLLLSSGSCMEAKDYKNATPLHWAVRNGHKYIVLYLLKVGADVEAITDRGDTPFHVAAENGHFEILNMLISEEADIHKRSNEGITPFLWAVYNGHINVANLLLSKGADIEKRDGIFGRTALIWATYNHNLAMVTFLKIRGADIEAEDCDSFTALHWAACKGYKRIVQLLCSDHNISPAY